MMAPWWVPRGPRSSGCRSWTSWAPAQAQRHRPGAGVAVGVAGVSQDVAERDAVLGHRCQHRDQGAGRVVVAGRDGHPAGQLGHRRAVLVAHHGGGRGVVAEEQLAVLSGAAAGAVPPGGFGVGAVAGAAWRGPGEGLHVGPVDGQRRAGVLELTGDGCLQQVVADPREGLRWQAVGDVPGQGICDQAEGALGLPAGEQVRAGLPVLLVRRAGPGRARAGRSARRGPGSGARAADRPGTASSRPAESAPAAAGGAPRWAAAPRSAAPRRRCR